MVPHKLAMHAHDSEHECPTDLTEYLQTLRDVVRLKSKGCSQERMQIDVPNQQATLPSKFYGEVNVSDNANAHLGDVYRFCDNDHAQQQRVLQEYKEQIERFSQRQSDQGAQLEQALTLIAEISQSIRMKENKSKSNHTQGSTLSRQYLSEILSFSQDERSAEQSLELAKSFARRSPFNPTSFVDPKHYIPQLNQWLTVTGSALLHIAAEALAREQATEIAVQLTASLKNSAHPIVWFLPVLQEQVTMQALMRTLAVQLLDRHCDDKITTKFPINTTTLEEDGSGNMWYELLGGVLNAVCKCFIIIEMPNQSSKLPDWIRSCDQLVAVLRSAVAQAGANGNVLKVLIVTHGSGISYSQPKDTTPEYWSCILKATPINIARARQLAAIQQRPLIQQLQTPVLNTE